MQKNNKCSEYTSYWGPTHDLLIGLLQYRLLKDIPPPYSEMGVPGCTYLEQEGTYPGWEVPTLEGWGVPTLDRLCRG